MKINVTKKDIWKGNRHCNRSCPITLALRRSLPEFKDIMVNGPFCRLKRTEINLPRRCMTFVFKFDAYGRKAVKPFSFIIPDAKLKYAREEN